MRNNAIYAFSYSSLVIYYIITFKQYRMQSLVETGIDELLSVLIQVSCSIMLANINIPPVRANLNQTMLRPKSHAYPSSELGPIYDLLPGPVWSNLKGC